MRELLITAGPVLIALIAAVELCFAALFFKGWGAEKKPILLCMGAVTVGLFLDALVIDLGCVVPVGALEAASRLRFVSHGVLIPLLFPICAYALKAKGWVLRGVWVVTGLLMAAGLAESLALVLEVKELGAIVRYVSSDASPAWADGISSALSYGTVIPLILCGIVAWVKQKTPFLFLSGFLMFAFSALGPATGNFDLIFLISMFGEVLMVLFFWLYSRRAD